MKLHYYRETDSLYIDLANRPSAESRQVAPGVVLDLGGAASVWVQFLLAHLFPSPVPSPSLAIG